MGVYVKMIYHYSIITGLMQVDPQIISKKLRESADNGKDCRIRTNDFCAKSPCNMRFFANNSVQIGQGML